jgi:O-antigen ligase
MSRLDAAASTPLSARWTRDWLPAAAVVVGIVGAVAVALLTGSKFGQVVVVGAAALALGVLALRSPVFAILLLVVTMFLFKPLKQQIHLPIPLFLAVFAVLIVSTALWIERTPGRLRGIGAIEWAMAVYLMWNIYSMFAPHEYKAGPQFARYATRDPTFSVPRFILVGALIPFVLYAVGRWTFDRAAAVLALFWTIVAVAAYSAVMSILPFTGPTEWVWPRYIVDQPSWAGRAVGVFDQPVVNGMVLALGFAIAILLASRRSEPAWRRLVAFVVAVGCGGGIYLTHTRAAWLSLAVVLIIGAILAQGFRKGFITILCLAITMIVVNWSVFTSADRAAGGVASPGQVDDRLNIDQTALWAAAQRPLTGWGIGRFDAVDTYHHQQWSLDTPWTNGFGQNAHQTELGILAELGLIGLVPWICVLALLAYQLWKAYRTLPVDDLCGKPLAVIAIMAFAIFVNTGLTVDVRNSDFDFPRVVLFLLAGIAIGWSERRKRGQAVAEGDLAQQLRPRHA